MRLKVPYLLALTMGAIGVFYGTSSQGLNASPTTSVTTDDNRQFELGSSGSTRLVSFYSPDCPFSKSNVTTLNSLHRELQINGVDVIAVAMPYDSPARVSEFRNRYEPDYHLTHDTDGTIKSAFPNVRFTPTTFLIDRHGKIVWRQTGRMRLDTVKDRVLESANDVQPTS